MKVWAATRDDKVLDLLKTAMRMRWPNSGRLIVPEVFDPDTGNGNGARDCDLAVVDTCTDGIDPCGVIRSIRRDSNVPVLILSDPKGDQTTTAKALANGADDYLFKPIEIIDMIFHMEAIAKVRLAK